MWTLTGFTTLFEVLQTYVPDPPQLGFRVPYMPEGMEGADWFDTYYGNVTKPLDLGQAQPLQCAYPATVPSTGDYLTVADTVPNPAPGSALYYLTAATFQGERRAGRKADEDGQLKGRDPSELPQCIINTASRDTDSAGLFEGGRR